ncbi:hypothetical protein PSAB6_10045 [Paraburkholderia sabiae]|nr:hypothetical protein PSAB6_10045 [Paraburkholderia sabiae]
MVIMAGVGMWRGERDFSGCGGMVFAGALCFALLLPDDAALLAASTGLVSAGASDMRYLAIRLSALRHFPLTRSSLCA